MPASTRPFTLNVLPPSSTLVPLVAVMLAAALELFLAVMVLTPRSAAVGGV